MKKVIIEKKLLEGLVELVADLPWRQVDPLIERVAREAVEFDDDQDDNTTSAKELACSAAGGCEI